MSPDSNDRGDSAQSGIARTWLLLDELARRAPERVGVSEVSRSTGLPKAVTHRMLRELVRVGLADFDETSKHYGLGWGAMAVGFAAMRSIDIDRIVRPHLVRLSGETGETATLSFRQDRERVYADQVLPDKEVRMAVTLGARYPLHAGSSSKAILSAMSDAEVEDYVRQESLTPLTPLTITDPDALKADLALIRARGFAESHGERQADAGSVAAPLRDVRGAPIGSISVCGPRQRVTPDFVANVAPSVVDAAALISGELGWLGR